MLTQGYTQEEYEFMMSESKLMAIHLVNSKIWIGLIYETTNKSIIFNPLQLEYYLSNDKKYHISFDYVSVATKDEIFIVSNQNILFCTTISTPIKEQYTKYYRIEENENKLEDEDATEKKNVININKKLH